MVKGSSSLCSSLVLLAVTFAVASDTNISYQIGELNNKLMYLQGRLDLFDYITEGNVSVLQHRVELNDSKCSENLAVQFNESNVKVNNLVDKVNALATDVSKLSALESQFNALATTVSSNTSTLLHRAEEKDLKYTENIAAQFKESNVKVNNLVDKVDALATDVSKLSALESKLDEFATTVSSHVSKEIQETNVKVNNLVDTIKSLATDVSKVNALESKLNALETTITNFVGNINETLLKPSSSCTNAFANHLLNRRSGVYNILPIANSSPFDVYCMADPKGGQPWTVVQRRVDGSVDFYRNWTEYHRGFGDLEGNFFIGLDKLHSLTTEGEPQQLWVKLTDPDGKSANAYYDAFAIGNASEKYPLNVLGKYSGDAGDSFSRHKSMKFSTYDNDNDNFDDGSCPTGYKSAWWFDSCHKCQLNGVYGSTQDGGGLFWMEFRDNSVSLKYAHMAIRPARK